MPSKCVLTAEQSQELLQNHAPAFAEASKKERKKVLQKAVKAIAPPGIETSMLLRLENKTKEFLYNHAGRREEKKDIISYMRNWTGYTVATSENKALLDSKMQEQHPGVKTSDREYIGLRQTLTSQWYNEQSKARLNCFKETARIWNKDGPPSQIQQKLAEEKIDQFVGEFMKQAWRLFGARGLTSLAWLNAEGKLDTSTFDFNDKFGGAPKFGDDRPGWEDRNFREEWGTYATKVMNAGEYDAEKDVKTRKNRQSTFALQYKDEAAVIPTEASKEFQNVRDKQAFIRQFCAHYYNIAVGDGGRKTLPWAELLAAPSRFIDPTFLPAGMTLQDPSRIAAANADKLIAHWRSRSEAGLVPLKFKSFKGKGGKIVVSEVLELETEFDDLFQIPDNLEEEFEEEPSGHAEPNDAADEPTVHIGARPRPRPRPVQSSEREQPLVQPEEDGPADVQPSSKDVQALSTEDIQLSAATDIQASSAEDASSTEDVQPTSAEDVQPTSAEDVQPTSAEDVQLPSTKDESLGAASVQQKKGRKEKKKKEGKKKKAEVAPQGMVPAVQKQKSKSGKKKDQVAEREDEAVGGKKRKNPDTPTPTDGSQPEKKRRTMETTAAGVSHYGTRFSGTRKVEVYDTRRRR